MAFQKSKTPDWNDLRIYLLLSQLGTLTAVGRKANMAPSSVARHIDRLERDLNIVLFQRSPQGYVTTDAGRLLLAEAQGVEAAIDGLVRQSAGLTLDVSGTVRIAMPENFATHIVIPSLQDLQSSYLNLKLEIVTDVRHANLTRREADIAIRLSRPKRGRFLVSKIGEMENGLFASKYYLASREFAHLSRGNGHMRIDWDESLQDLPLAVWLEETLPAARPVLSATSLGGQVAAAQGGIGIAALPAFLATGLDRLDERKLLQDIFLITHRDIRQAPGISVVMDYLRKLFHRNAGILHPSASPGA